MRVNTQLKSKHISATMHIIVQFVGEKVDSITQPFDNVKMFQTLPF